jgi:23S rRNA (cytidine1920-2'-O)/16S rRNA (cytidine1409-2'-O)-methyltransferase
MQKKAQKKRLDELLLERGLVEDLKAAQSLIMAGQVLVQDQRSDKPSMSFATDVAIRLKNVRRYLSRAGEKLHAFWHKYMPLEPRNAVVLDVGSSTGGFSDFMLKHGAKRVVCVDVGTNQLDWSLRQNPAVEVHEQTDIRQFQSSEIFDYVLSDLSFIKTTHLLEVLSAFLTPSKSTGIFLIKPQFELIDHDGVVTDSLQLEELAKLVRQLCNRCGLEILFYEASDVLGRQGNQEFFLAVRKKAPI